VVAVAAMLGGCASEPDRAPVQYLDRDTAATFTVVAAPLTFAHVRPEVAARVRDYATVAAAAMERNGHTDYVLLVYLWSTVDPRNGPGPPRRPPDLVLAADDRRIALRPISDRAQPLPPVDRPPVRHFVAAMYPTDLPTLRFLISARYLSLVRGEGTREARFELWHDDRASLADWVRTVQ
jgi:hypothetical protein